MGVCSNLQISRSTGEKENGTLGNISYRTGNKLLWDHSKKLFLNDEKANAFIKPEYRAHWKFPAVD